MQGKDDQEIQREVQLPKTKPIVIEHILDKRVSKKTRGKEYYEYLVKWKYHPIEYSTWMTATMLQKSGVTIDEFMYTSP